MIAATGIRRPFGWIVAIILLPLMAACSEPKSEAAASLPHLGAKIDETTVSGISSGAYMAGQFQMAHGRIVKGAAIIAGGPYGCSESIFADALPGTGSGFLNLSKAVNGCMLDLLGLWGVADGKTLAEKAAKRAEEGLIDPIASTANDRVYLFAGTSDRTVMPSIVQHAADFYRALGLPEDNIMFVKSVPAGHAFVTDNDGGTCSRSEKPYVVDCDYDQAGALLGHLYGALHPRTTAPTGDFITFDQRPFGASTAEGGLAATGVVYVPKACNDGQCRVHIAFHGCAQNKEAVDDAFIKGSGFARWADSNKLIVLFPQVETTTLNPQGCWDWWGYTGRQFLTQSAPQIAAVFQMLNTLQKSGSGA